MTFLGLRKKAVVVIYLIGACFVLLLLTSDYIVSGVYNYYWGFHTKVGRLHNLFLIFFNAIWIKCLIILYKSYRAKNIISPLEFNRRRYVFLAFIIVSIASIDFIPNYGKEFYPFGFIFVGLKYSGYVEKFFESG